jgi:gluconate 2-dehydrogenase gamma chain
VRNLTRRSFLRTVGAAAAAPACASFAHAAQVRYVPARAVCAAAAAEYDFFEAAEARFIEAACERLIPADRSGAGALGAGVPRYLDAQLNGDWGAGRQPYRSGPWQPGTPLPAHSLRLTPAELFRTALAAILQDVGERGMNFWAADPQLQIRYLRTLEAGGEDLDGVPSAVFFDMLLTMTVEGFFSNPRCGGNRDRVPWRLQGFPGAYARR